MKENEFFFVQISDLQFGMFRPGENVYPETDLVKLAVERLNALGPDFVLCTGDLVDVPGSEDQMAIALELLKELDRNIPFLAVPGNHDLGDAPSSENLDWFRRRIGRDRYSFIHCGWHFVGLNSCLMADVESAAEETESQWAWLEEDLGRKVAAKAEGTIAFMHHPLFLKNTEEGDDYFNLPLPSRARCLELFRKHRVRTVLAGHLHRCSEADGDDVNVVVSGPVGMPLEDGFSGLRMVRVGEEGVRHKYFALDDRMGQEQFLEG